MHVTWLPAALGFSLMPMLSCGLLFAQQPADKAPVDQPPALRTATDGSFLTLRDARVITLKIPAPRGPILDRNGEVFANNEVCYRVALQYRQFQSADRAFVLQWAKSRLSELSALGPQLPSIQDKTEDELYNHYRDRRWLPLYLSSEITAERASQLEKLLPKDVILSPVYRRSYPHGKLAAHVLGYAGSVGDLPTGPINFNEPLWEEMEGRAGLEKLFDSSLTGTPGTKRLLFDEHGKLLLDEQVKRPLAGASLVTTLDLKWQQIAEKALEEGCQRGAFVVIDCITGEVLVLASWPSFDLNTFIPRISEDQFRALNEDPAAPLYGRAFQSAYPPASTFKPIVAMAALNTGTVTAETLIDCPAAIAVGNAVFNNWTDVPEGEINVIRAITRSCNTWFYQVGIQMGPEPFIELSRRLGYGQRTGLPLIGETPGILPDNAWMRQHEGRPILDGDTANLSIGQGSMLTSPLQVAQAMAAIGNGEVLPKLHLIAQRQDQRGRVIEAPNPQPRNILGMSQYSVLVTRMGMANVVNGGGGTGHGAKLSYTKLCGKTGTAQWGPPSKNQRLAWFAGFLPEDHPRYAFAVLYEGKPNERVSGGRLAAPMVRKFFEAVKADIKEVIEPPKRATVILEGADEGSIPQAKPVSEDDAGQSPGPSEGFLSRSDDEPLRARPVELLDTGNAVRPLTPTTPDAQPLPPRAEPVEENAPRAQPVEEEAPRAEPIEGEAGP